MKIFLFFFALIAASQVHVFSQTVPVVKNLVFEGAGIRGIAYCGAVSELEAAEILPQVERVGGTSAGAITAMAVALGYTGTEIRDIITSTNYRRFNDGRYFFIGGINRVNRYFGWYRGSRIGDWLEKIIEAKTGNSNITFEEFYSRGFKDLFITGTCLNRQQLVVFSRFTYPKMKVKDAVRISMSIPLYFEAVFIDSSGNIVRHPRKKDGLDVMIDGGITGNFPIKIFDGPHETNTATIGFRIDTDEQIVNDRATRQITAMQIGNFNQYMAAFYNMVIENLNRQGLTNEDWSRTISISDGKISPRIRKLSREEINLLIENGRRATRAYFN